jgi:hypothetical protein
MATTYSRIRAALGEMNGQDEWTPDDLREALLARDQERNESTFHITTGRATRPAPLSASAFSRLFSVMEELSFLTKTADENLKIDPTTARSLSDDRRFRELTTRRVMSLLEARGAPLADIREATNRIQLPKVRDAETILLELQKQGKGRELDGNDFSRLLFLLACTKQRAKRHMRIFYDFE